jgi:hypothetical protein
MIDPAERLYVTICELWSQYAVQPRSDVTREFLKRYPATGSYRELLLLPRRGTDPLNLFGPASGGQSSR